MTARIFFLVELAGFVVGLHVDHLVGEGLREQHTAELPPLLEGLAALLRRWLPWSSWDARRAVTRHRCATTSGRRSP